MAAFAEVMNLASKLDGRCRGGDRRQRIIVGLIECDGFPGDRAVAEDGFALVRAFAGLEHAQRPLVERERIIDRDSVHIRFLACALA